MQRTVYIVLAILLFGFLIFVHELGHFLVAKWMGVRVNEFALCMGPAIWQKKVGETTYSLRCIPLGGYCAMEGEDERSSDPRAFTSKARWRQALILVAGAFMNFLVGFLILLVLSAMSRSFATPVIAGFYDGSGLDDPGRFQVGDRIISIDGERVYRNQDIELILSRGDDTSYDIVVRRDGKTVTLSDQVMEKKSFTIEGRSYLLYGLQFSTQPKTIDTVVREAWFTAIDFARMVKWGLLDLFSGSVGLRDFSGPVGIVSMISESGEEAPTTWVGVLNVLYIGAFLAINLAYMNMLPIPALDGGRVFFLLVTAAIEKVIRRRLNPKYEGYIHAAGMVVLMAFMVFVTFSDLWKLFAG